MKSSRWIGVAMVAGLLGGPILNPALGVTYDLDVSHTRVGFTVRHLGISSVSGQFTEFEGTIEFDGSLPESVKAKGKIKVSSIDTGNEKRDEHLRNEDFFHVEKFPEITFETTEVVRDGEDQVLKGKFSMHGVTLPIEMKMHVEGPIQDPWDNQRIGMALEGVVNRLDYGVGGDGAADKLVGKEVKINIQLEAIGRK